MDFGGIRGQHLSDLVVQMYNEFNELSNAFQSRGDDPLDTTNTVSQIFCKITCRSYQAFLDAQCLYMYM